MALDSLQEFRVITANADVEFGSAAGAQVELVTQSGTNNLHGNLRWYHRNHATAANNFFNNKAGVPVPKQIRHQYGFSLGGPLVKDRAFFFVDWEQRRDNSERVSERLVPSDGLKAGVFVYQIDSSVPGFDPTAPGVMVCPTNPNDFCRELTSAEFTALDPAGLGMNSAMLDYAALYPSGNQGFDSGDLASLLRFNAPVQVRNNLYTTRFDFNLDPAGKHTVFWRGSLADIKHQITTPPHFPDHPPSGDFLNNGKGFATDYRAVIGTNLVNSFTYGYTRAGIEQSGQAGDIFRVSYWDTHKSYDRGFGHRIPTHNLRNDLTWMQGRHTVQTGINLRLIRNDRFAEMFSYPEYGAIIGACISFCADPFFGLLFDADPNNDPADFLPFVISYLMLTGPITLVTSTFQFDPGSNSLLPPGTPQARQFAENDVEFYIQDKWRITRTLTLTAGLRYSYFGPIWEQNGVQVALLA
jgi:hypothetical protein